MALSDTGYDKDEPAPDEAASGAEEKQPLTLDVRVDKPGACERHVTVSISRPDVDRYLQKAFSELAPKASVPGFRSGRAPRRLVESHFRKEVAEQVKSELLMDSMTQVTEQQDFSAISEPDFDFRAIELPESGPMTFEFDLEVRPEFEMPKWQGLRIERPVRDFTDKDVAERMAYLLRLEATAEPKDGPVALNDLIVANLTARQDGKVIGEISESSLVVREQLTFPDGEVTDFGKKLVGAKAGETRVCTLQVGDGAVREELRGADLELSVEIVEVKQLIPPGVTDELLDSLGIEDESHLKSVVRSQLEHQLGYFQQRRVREQISASLTEAAKWSLPPALLQRQTRRELQRAIMELQSSGFSAEEVRAHENDLRRNSEQSTARALKEHFILERLAEELELDVTAEDIESEITSIAQRERESRRTVQARIEKRGLIDALRNQIVERKAIEAIEAAAQKVEVPYQPPRPKVTAVDEPICGVLDADIPEAKHGGDVRELPELTDHR